MPRIHATFLAAHVLPPEFFGRRREYVEAVRLWTAEAAQAGADSIDVHRDEGRSTVLRARWPSPGRALPGFGGLAERVIVGRIFGTLVGLVRG